MVLFVLLAALALAQPPVAFSLDDPDRAVLASGGVVARSAPDGDGFRSLTAIDIAAPPAVVMAAVVALRARVGELRSVDAITVYRDIPGEIAARWTTSALGIGAAFSVIYRYNLADGWCTYALDPSQDNDLAQTTGSYSALPNGAGTRLLFENAARTPYPVPLWMQQRVQLAGMREQLLAIKARAERAASSAPG